MYTNLEQLATDVSTCHLCPLGATRLKAVPGSGSGRSGILFIGEGPGKNEDEQGLPFVGAAGKLLNEMLATIHLAREDVFITNVVKCRPPQNRDPLPEEVAACRPYLLEQIRLLAPKLIVTLGRHAMYHFLPMSIKITDAHGTPMRRHGQIFYPMYHPAAALYNGGLRDTLFADMQKVPAILKKIDKLPKAEKLAELSDSDILGVLVATKKPAT